MSKSWGFFFGGSGHGIESSCQISAYCKFFPGFNVFCRISTGLSCHRTASDANWAVRTLFIALTRDYVMLGGIHTCLEVSSDRKVLSTESAAFGSH